MWFVGVVHEMWARHSNGCQRWSDHLSQSKALCFFRMRQKNIYRKDRSIVFECSIYFWIKKFSIYLLNSNSWFPVDIGHNFCSNYLMNNIVINWVGLPTVGGVQQTEFYYMYTYFIFTNIVCIALIYRSLVEWLLK